MATPATKLHWASTPAAWQHEVWVLDNNGSVYEHEPSERQALIAES